MTDKLEWKYDGVAIEIEYESVTPMLSSEILMRFSDRLLLLANAAHLTAFSLKQQASPATDYVYHFEDARGHKWTQVLHNPAQDDYETSAQFDAFNRIRIIELHQRVIESCILLIRTFAVSKIEATWNE